MWSSFSKENSLLPPRMLVVASVRSKGMSVSSNRQVQWASPQPAMQFLISAALLISEHRHSHFYVHSLTLISWNLPRKSHKTSMFISNMIYVLHSLKSFFLKLITSLKFDLCGEWPASWQRIKFFDGCHRGFRCILLFYYVRSRT